MEAESSYAGLSLGADWFLPSGLHVNAHLGAGKATHQRDPIDAPWHDVATAFPTVLLGIGKIWPSQDIGFGCSLNLAYSYYLNYWDRSYNDSNQPALARHEINAWLGLDVIVR